MFTTNITFTQYLFKAQGFEEHPGHLRGSKFTFTDVLFATCRTHNNNEVVQKTKNESERQGKRNSDEWIMHDRSRVT